MISTEWTMNKTMTFRFGEDVTLIKGSAMGGDTANDHSFLRLRLDMATKDSPPRYSLGSRPGTSRRKQVADRVRRLSPFSFESYGNIFTKGQPMLLSISASK
jgi:hypothetical protein